MIWYYSKRHGFVLHGLWIGERDANGQLIFLGNKVRRDRDIRREPLYGEVISMLDRLPTATVEELKEFWFSERTWSNPELYVEGMHNRQYPVFWISQLLKHGVQDGLILFPDYYDIILVKLCKPLVCKDSPDSLSEIMKAFIATHPYQPSRGDLVEAISNGFGKNIELKFRKRLYESDPWKPSKLSFLYEENGDKVDHPSRATRKEEYFCS